MNKPAGETTGLSPLTSIDLSIDLFGVPQAKFSPPYFYVGLYEEEIAKEKAVQENFRLGKQSVLSVCEIYNFGYCAIGDTAIDFQCHTCPGVNYKLDSLCEHLKPHKEEILTQLNLKELKHSWHSTTKSKIWKGRSANLS